MVIIIININDKRSGKMAKRSIRKPIPRSRYGEMMRIARRLVDKDEQMGDTSPLKDLEMKQFRDNVNTADDVWEQAKKHRQKSEALMQKFRGMLGVEVGQNMSTPDTIYYFMGLCRDLLAVKFRGNEDEMSTWGFDIVISSVVPHKKKENN